MILVPRQELKPGEEYYIESLTYAINGQMVANGAIERLIGTFDKHQAREDALGINGGYKFAHFNNYRGVNEPITKGYPVQLNALWNFYEVKKYKIQRQMEKRALNIILRNVIGDEYFYIEFYTFSH